MIENIQRDLNIDLGNELANFFNRMGSPPAGHVHGDRHQVTLPAVPAFWPVSSRCTGVSSCSPTHKAQPIG